MGAGFFAAAGIFSVFYSVTRMSVERLLDSESRESRETTHTVAQHRANFVFVGRL